MRWNVREAAVIGAGVMGAAIAAHLANAGVRCRLLDIGGLADAGLKRLAATKPPALYDPAFASRVAPGDLDDSLQALANCDWIIEAVTEKMDAKRAVWAKIQSVWREGVVVSSNTSGLSINEIVAACSPEMRRHSLVTHFFNPPRYMKLLEIVPCRETDSDVQARVSHFCRERLGKDVVVAKDTPNFIANRIGAYATLIALRAMESHGLSIEEVDAVTGPLIGRPKSATFRTLDIVGLDTFLHVARTVSDRTDDPLEAEAFGPPELLTKLTSLGRFGEKNGQGFYRKETSGRGESRILSLDPATMDYRPRREVSSPGLTAIGLARGTAGKLKALLEVAEHDRLAAYARDVLDSTLCYAADKLGEIADTPEQIDRAMKGGFNWDLGPFETWDALGVEETARRLEERGLPVPAAVAALLEKGKSAFYEKREGRRYFYYHGDYRGVEQQPDELSLRMLKERGGTVFAGEGASLVDLGDEVVCLEFHSPHNAIGPGVLSAIRFAAEETARNWRGLVVANEGRNFCVGANLLLLLLDAENGDWDEIDFTIRRFQDAMASLRKLPRPVVAAPHRMTLGGGVEACLPADRIVFASETYFGLVETGVGLIPAGGGCLAAAALASDRAKAAHLDDVQPPLAALFETIAMAKTSSSGHDAIRLGYGRPADRVVVREEMRFAEAKRAVLELDRIGYASPEPDVAVTAGGRESAAVLKLGVAHMRRSGYISDHDARIAGKLAHALTGGDVPAGTVVSGQHLLDLEREAFLSLCGEPLTQARMRHMLATNKPLRN